MDNNTYFQYQMDLALDKADMLDKLREQVTNAIDHGPVPAALQTALDFLLFLASYENPGHVRLSEAYGEVASRLSMCIYHMHCKVSSPELTWPACCATCPERHPDDELEDDPEEPEDEQEEAFGDGPDGEPGGEDGGDEIFAVMQKFYGPHKTPAHIGAYRPFPDYEHWSHWTDEDWINFERYKHKVVAAATCEISTMCLAISSLAGIKANMGILPMDRQVEVAIWASDVVDHLTAGLEAELFKMCKGTLYTREGRKIQRQLLSASQEG